MANERTIMLSGTEQEVKISGQNCDIRNDGVDIIYASRRSSVVAGEDGVLSVPAGQAAKLLDTGGTVYLLGTGSVMLCGNDYAEPVFKSAASASGGGGTTDDVARQAISTHSGNAEIHLTAEKAVEAAATVISNPNLLINPDFRINQRGKSGAITDVGYFVDRWQLVSGTVTVNSDGTLTLNGTIKQILENAVDSNTTVSANAGTPSYDNSTKTFTLTAAGEIIKWAKLELGKAATPFAPPDPATEPAKCQRYFYAIPFGTERFIGHGGDVGIGYVNLPLPTTMRIAPTISNSDGSETKLILANGNTMISDVTITQVHRSQNGVTLAITSENITNGQILCGYHQRADDNSAPAMYLSAEL